ncbi:glutathione S-transferase 3-like [Olea europaea var. sylvestris]|uniref:glutathione S-transferase 3-like n=1 Tax=Olea europaea var. sylvestris TaxID=158386 RepID=UPI000C1CD210|nr:glutathione S-transferase 3-like [Olea europaea var. sylvestris]
MDMSGSCEIVVVDFWANGFGMRVRIALEEKGIMYKYEEENLENPQRSQLVLDMNPVRKSVPILIDEGKPVCDSLAILEYIDERWKDGFPSLLPEDPYERAVARFWAQYVDNKIFDTQAKFLKSKGETKEDVKKELIGQLKLLDDALGEKLYFGGDKFGYLDVAFIPFSSMFSGYESHGSFKLEEECPKLSAWVKRCLAREGVSRVLPDFHQIYEIHKKWYGVE